MQIFATLPRSLADSMSSMGNAGYRWFFVLGVKQSRRVTAGFRKALLLLVIYVAEE